MLLAGVIHFSERQVVEMPSEARREGVSASTWGTHGAGKIDVHQFSKSPCKKHGQYNTIS